MRVATSGACLGAALALLSCHGDPDSYIVIHSDVNCDVPRVYQLQVTIDSNGLYDQKTIPPVPGAELGFPSSLVLELPGSRSGAFSLEVDALDNDYHLIGAATANGTIAVGGKVDIQVQIVAAQLTGQSAVVDAGSAIHADGGSALEGATRPNLDLVAASSPPFVQASPGGSSTCAIRSDTSLWCWGQNDYGQLDLSGTSDRLTPVATGGLAWTAVALGQTHACGARSDGSLACWGNNGSGQLGSGTSSPPSSSTATSTSSTTSGQQIEVAGGPWQDVAAGSYHTCAIKADASLWCWGDNTNGQLGTGNTTPSGAPVEVNGTGWAKVSGSYLHTCAVKGDGTLWCWGLQADSQLGNSSAPFYSPGQITGSTWSKVVTGLNHTCGLQQDGTLWCWGGNYQGQLGNASIPAQAESKTAEPVQVAGTWLDVAAGQSHTCAIQSDHSLWCWGDDSQGQLGDAKETPEATPVPVASTGQAWQAVAAGPEHSCALATDGSLWCWGSNSNGQLGIGTTDWRQAPTRVVQ